MAVSESAIKSFLGAPGGRGLADRAAAEPTIHRALDGSLFTTVS